MMVCEDLESLMLKMASDLPWDYKIRQAYLEEATLAGQYEVLLSNLIHEIEVSQIHRELQEKVGSSGSRIAKMYVENGADGEPRHVGYVIAGHRLKMFAPIELPVNL